MIKAFMYYLPGRLCVPATVTAGAVMARRMCADVVVWGRVGTARDLAAPISGPPAPWAGNNTASVLAPCLWWYQAHDRLYRRRGV